MKLRKLYLVMSACAVVGMSGISAANASTDKGTIKFTGEVIASTCDVTVDSTGPTGTVTLDKASVTELSGVGMTALPKLFTIGVTGCTTGTGAPTSIGVYFAPGSGAPTDEGNLANEETGTSSTDVSLQLVDVKAGNKPINLNANQNTGSKFVLDATGAGTLNYAVQYYSNVVTPGVGKVTANAVYELYYN